VDSSLVLNIGVPRTVAVLGATRRTFTVSMGKQVCISRYGGTRCGPPAPPLAAPAVGRRQSRDDDESPDDDGPAVTTAEAGGGTPTPSPRLPEGPAPLVTLDDIRAAATTLRGIALRTPLVGFGPSEDRRFLKAESLQPIGAFKIRGAYVAVAALTDEERRRGVITYSSGNHAQGVARAARLLGAPAVIVMPSDAPAIKRVRVEADGAEVVIVGPTSDERRVTAERLADERGLAIIPPFDDDRVIAGQGTCGLEIAEDLPDLAAVLVPIGGGGLAAGVATAVRALRPSARIVGVEPALAADALDSFRARRVVEWSAADVARTSADGTRTRAIGTRNLAHLLAALDDIVTVDEAEIDEAIRLAATEARLVVEPSGALSIAALRFRAREAGLDRIGGPVVAVVSGGNIDPARYAAILAEGRGRPYRLGPARAPLTTPAGAAGRATRPARPAAG
jgi:threonine dehydratase